MNAQPIDGETPQPKPHRQVRYAVVLNGGVSLAVWMGGVTHELNRMRLASRALDDDTRSSTALDECDPWTRVLRTAHRTALVDLVAGTSAGGLNGTMLATAIATGADMPAMREVWSDTASLTVGELIRPHPEDSNSLLDGDFFQKKIDALLKGMATVPGKEQECTLLVTATALDSTVISTPLETGGALSVRDGRRVYKFARTKPRPLTLAADENSPAHAPGGGSDFDVVDDEQKRAVLALAARASASFPVAFAPVWENPYLIARRVVPKDDRVTGGWLVDGGVLDNAPIEPLLEALRQRPTDEPYECVMLYITPGVGQPAGATASASSIPAIRQTLSSVLSAIREPDERMDLDSLRRIFDDMSLTRTQAHDLAARILRLDTETDINNLKEATRQLFPQYRWARTEAFERFLASTSGLVQTSPFQPPNPPTLDADDVPGMPATVFPDWDSAGWTWGSAAADRCVRWWSRALSTLYDPDDEDQGPKILNAMKVLANAQQEITGLGKPIRAAVSGDLSNVKPSGIQLTMLRDLYANGSTKLDEIYGPASGSLTARLGRIMGASAEALHSVVPQLTAHDLLDSAVCVEVLSGWRAWGGADYDAPVFRFHNVTPAAKPPRVIPLDSLPNLSDWPIKKLWGQRLGHFGAFAKKQGRENDWLWGRIDGASELARQILAAGGIKGDAAEDHVDRLVDEILADELPTNRSDPGFSRGYDPDEVARRAREAYDADNDLLISEVRADHRAMAKLEDTVWALSKELGPIGFWVRTALQPEWTEDDAGPDRKRRRYARWTRRIIGWGLKLFRSKLPPELQYSARREQSTPDTTEDAPLPSD